MKRHTKIKNLSKNAYENVTFVYNICTIKKTTERRDKIMKITIIVQGTKNFIFCHWVKLKKEWALQPLKQHDSSYEFGLIEHTDIGSINIIKTVN